MSTSHDPYAALRVRDYRCLLAGGVLASIGGEIQAIAVGWELYDRTRQPEMIGWAGLAQFLPVLLLVLPAGQAADRYSRKVILQLAQVTMALTSIGLALLSLSQGPVELIFVCLTLAGCARAFSMPSRSSLVSQIVPREVLPNAITWNSTGFQVANVTGPAVGGAMIALLGRAAGAYWLAAGCCLGCALLLMPIRPRVSDRPRKVRSLTSLLLGIKFVFRSQLLLAAITLDLFAVLLGGATALLPVYASDILEVGAAGLGWLRAAPAMGAVLIALVLAHRPPLRRPGLALLLSVAGFGVATICFGFSRDPVLSFALLALTGALDNISVVVRGTLMQVLTPDEMRGRVSAVNSVFISSSNELGAFESGMTAKWFGPVGSVVGGGIGTIFVVLVAALRWPLLVRLGPLHEVKPSDPALVPGAE